MDLVEHLAGEGEVARRDQGVAAVDLRVRGHLHADGVTPLAGALGGLGADRERRLDVLAFDPEPPDGVQVSRDERLVAHLLRECQALVEAGECRVVLAHAREHEAVRPQATYERAEEVPLARDLHPLGSERFRWRVDTLPVADERRELERDRLHAGIAAGATQ
jgi:hypothetical protein